MGSILGSTGEEAFLIDMRCGIANLKSGIAHLTSQICIPKPSYEFRRLAIRLL